MPGRGVLGVLLVASTVSPLVARAPAARADCVHVEFYVTRKNAEPVYPVNEDPCVYETGWDTFTAPSASYTDHGADDGEPNGFYVKVGIPTP